MSATIGGSEPERHATQEDWKTPVGVIARDATNGAVVGPDLSSSTGSVELNQTANLKANDTTDNESARETVLVELSGQGRSAGIGCVEPAEDAPTRAEEPPADGTP